MGIDSMVSSLFGFKNWMCVCVVGVGSKAVGWAITGDSLESITHSLFINGWPKFYILKLPN